MHLNLLDATYLDDWWDARRAAEWRSICWWSLLMSSLSRWSRRGGGRDRGGRRREGEGRGKEWRVKSLHVHTPAIQLTSERAGKIEDRLLSCKFWQQRSSKTTPNGTGTAASCAWSQGHGLTLTWIPARLWARWSLPISSILQTPDPAYVPAQDVGPSPSGAHGRGSWSPAAG